MRRRLPGTSITSRRISRSLCSLLSRADELAEVTEFHCEVVELIDPAAYLGDEVDGIFCRTRKGAYHLNLPLLDLHLPEDSPNFQLIEDYWYWFWNWR